MSPSLGSSRCTYAREAGVRSAKRGARLLTRVPMRLPNWMARLTRPAARGSPSRCRAARSTSLSPSPAHAAALIDVFL